MDERIFFCTEGDAHKFWRVCLEGAMQTVRWGRIGTSGQTLTREFATFQEANEATEKLIAQKLGKGYRSVSAAEAEVPVVAPAAPRRRRLAVPSRQLLLPLEGLTTLPAAPLPLAERSPASPLALAFDL